jgi:hypothetical protein
MADFEWMVIGEMLHCSKFPKISGLVERLCISNHKYPFNINEIVGVNFTAQKPQRFSATKINCWVLLQKIIRIWSYRQTNTLYG